MCRRPSPSAAGWPRAIPPDDLARSCHAAPGSGLGLTAAWVPNFLLTVIIWRNRVTDGQLAAKLPVPLLAGVGLALLLTWLWRRSRLAGSATALALCVALAQADRGHPVDGWYPVTHWREGEIVRDQYLLLMPKGNAPAAMRIAMYRSDPELGFIKSPWLSLPIPEK